MACNEACGMKSGRRSKGDTWWWNEEVWVVIVRQKDAHRAMCRNSSEENKNKYKSIKSKAKKVVLKAMREKAEEGLTELKNYQNVMSKLVIGLKIDRKEVESVRCTRVVIECCASVRRK